MKRLPYAIIGACLLAASFRGGVAAQSSADSNFYAGKTISLVIGSGPAGVYDLGGRLIAQFLEKYIAGHPTIVTRNMPGASSVIAAEYVYNVAPRDGLTLASVQPTIVLNKLLDPSVKYQPEKFTWIGRVQPVVTVGIAWRASGVETIADCRTGAVVMSASGASGTSAIVPWALNRLAGTRFRVIDGYESQYPQFVAMERGEVQGVGSADLDDVLSNADWVRNHRIAMLYVISRARSARAPGVPSIVELARNDVDRKVLAMLGGVNDIGQTLMAPPGIPLERRRILREAFAAMIGDHDFVTQARKLGIFVDPMAGEALFKSVFSFSEATPEVIAKLRASTQPQF